MPAPPLLLLDVDGVLNAVSRRGDPSVWPDWRSGSVRNSLGTYPILFSPSVCAAVRRWHEDGLAEVRWLTTWRGEANGELRRLLDLPELPVVGGEEPAPVRTAPRPARTHAEAAGADARSALTGRWWKFDLVLQVLDDEPGRPLVWVDDDLAGVPDVQQWVQTHSTCLLLAPRPHLGLTPTLLQTAEQWLLEHRPPSVRVPGG